MMGIRYFLVLSFPNTNLDARLLAEMVFFLKKKFPDGGAVRVENEGSQRKPMLRPEFIPFALLLRTKKPNACKRPSKH